MAPDMASLGSHQPWSILAASRHLNTRRGSSVETLSVERGQAQGQTRGQPLLIKTRLSCLS